MVEHRAWLIPLSALLVATIATPERVHAQEVELSFPNRALTNTYMKTRSDTLALTDEFASIFSPSAIACRRREGTCTVRIEMSTEFEGAGFLGLLPVYTEWRAILRDSIVPIIAGPGVNVELLPGQEGLRGGRTFSWILWNLESGFHTIVVQARRPPPSPILGGAPVALVFGRTVTITVYEP